MAVKNLLSQSIFQAKKLKEASAQIVKESLLSDLTKDMKRMIRQQEQQEIPNQEQEDLLEDLTEPQEDQKILTDNQEDLVNEDQEILTNDQEEEVPPEQQLNDEELNEIIQELQNDQEEQELIPPEEEQWKIQEEQELISPEEEQQEQVTDEDLLQRIREILESQQEQIPAEQKEEIVDECQQQQNKVPVEVVQAFKKKVRELTRENRQYKRSLQIIREQLKETQCLQLKGKYALNIFNRFNLTKAQKMKIIENFDRANNEREIKLVYATLMQGLTNPSKKTIASKTGASNRINSTRTKIKENRDMIDKNQNSLENIARIFKRRAGVL